MWAPFCEEYSPNAEKETRYLIYTNNGIIECADIDDMTDHTNALMHNGCKEIRLVIND